MRISDWSSDVCSSDLTELPQTETGETPLPMDLDEAAESTLSDPPPIPSEPASPFPEPPSSLPPPSPPPPTRSEEHTSELQSLMRISYAVFCLNKKRVRCSTISTNNTDYRKKHT